MTLSIAYGQRETTKSPNHFHNLEQAYRGYFRMALDT